MAERIVDALEMIEIEEHQRGAALVAPALFHDMAEAVAQQQPVGQAGQRVVVGEILDLLLRRLALGDIVKGADVIDVLAIAIAHGRDRQPFRIHRTVLAAIPNLAFPASVINDLAPHPGIEGFVVTPGLQDAGRLPHHLLPHIPGDVGKSLIDVDDDPIAVGHHQGFRGMGENTLGQAKRRLLAIARRHIGINPDRTLLHVTLIKRPTGQHDADSLSVETLHAVFRLG
ncbi:hypothetical protein SDC9_178840 [bioreactor metagenome]|uniref:Uncharacterized protein n=1 Tax=bioreactor metagenome TaxID=1076179 RepID=A0A645GYN2_9ZZZZ